jgi:hypothetical protein
MLLRLPGWSLLRRTLEPTFFLMLVALLSRLAEAVVSLIVLIRFYNDECGHSSDSGNMDRWPLVYSGSESSQLADARPNLVLLARLVISLPLSFVQLKRFLEEKDPFNNGIL